MDEVKPDTKPGDAKARVVRERAMDLVAGAAIHAQRIEDAATRLGLTPDLVDGLGDALFDAAVTQLDVASRILERSQGLVDRLFDLSSAKDKTCFERVDVTAGQPGRIDLAVRNSRATTATVSVVVQWSETGEKIRVGRPELPGNRETAIEITLPTTLSADQVYAMTVEVSLSYDVNVSCVRLPIREYEIWVRP